jgi:hypothetical protein
MTAPTQGEFQLRRDQALIYLKAMTKVSEIFDIIAPNMGFQDHIHKLKELESN